jgi:hypothetical protein
MPFNRLVLAALGDDLGLVAFMLIVIFVKSDAQFSGKLLDG